MAMRELVSGGPACAEPASSSNPLGALANALIGSSSKPQERLQEIPTSTNRLSNGNIYEGGMEPFNALPGSEFDHPPHPSSQGSEFLQGFRSSGQDAFANAWDEIQNSQMPLFRGRNNLTSPDQTQFQPQLNGPPQRVLSNFLHSFVNSGHGGLPFHPTPLPALGLSEGEKQRIRDRSSIMARHLFADKNEDFVNAQVNALLSSLDIDTDVQARAGPPGRSQEMENVWNDSQNMQNGPGGADGWIAEYDQHRVQRGDPSVWAQSFEQLHGANGWASEFENEQSQIALFDQVRGASIPSLAAMEQTRVLAHTLAQNQDPKFQVRPSRVPQPVSQGSVCGPAYQYMEPPIPYHEYTRLVKERDYLFGLVTEMKRMRSIEADLARERTKLLQQLGELRRCISDRMTQGYMSEQELRELIAWIMGELSTLGGPGP